MDFGILRLFIEWSLVRIQPGEPNLASADRDRLSQRSPQLPKKAPHLLYEQLRLFEGSEMTALSSQKTLGGNDREYTLSWARKNVTFPVLSAQLFGQEVTSYGNQEYPIGTLILSRPSE